MVYYRKYRPQTIEELDSTKVRETLKAVLSSQNIPHAFLFTGPKGLGKTSTARIIAKVVNCTAPKKDRKNGFEPCGTCDSCVSITNGSNIDVLEIDGASNRGIDEIRDLREKVKLAPSSAKKKVYIIDEVHMLTTEAFNALLKTIEEPPSHVMFMFATTEPQKVPATILSRCFHVTFPRATDEDIVHSLERIVKGEKLDVGKDALFEIAQMADGGFRDGAKMLEEIVLLANGEKVTKEFVQTKIKSSSSKLYVASFFEHLGKKETKNALSLIAQLSQEGVDIKYFLSECLQALHELLLMREKVITESAYQVSVNMFTSTEELGELVLLFSKAYQDTKYAVVPQLPLELAVIEWCQQENQELRSKSQEYVIPAKAGNQEDGSRITPIQSGIKSGTTSNKGLSIDEARKKEQNLKVRSILDGKKEEKPTKVVASASQNPIPHNVDALTQLMENIIYKVKPYNHSLAGVLRGCDITSFDETKLTLETAYKFHKERLDDKKAQEILEQIVKEITGKQIQILIQLKS